MVLGLDQRSRAWNGASFAVLLSALALAGCGGTVTPADGVNTADGSSSTDGAVPSDAGSPDVASADVPTDNTFAPAMHYPLTQVPDRGGPTIRNVRLVTITYADDPNRAELESFGSWIGGSNWLATVGPDYNVGAGTLLANVERTDNAPDAISSTEIETMLAAGIADGSIPSPPDHNFSNVLYMVYFPAHTVITLVSPGGPSETSCNSFGGYHSEVNHAPVHVAYAAVPDCSGSGRFTDVSAEELAASHEYMEAASDPFPMTHPAYSLPADGSSAWAFVGGEIGDLCELSHSTTSEGNFTVQRIYSNSAAAADRDPCIPADPTRPYFNVSIDPGDVQFASAGDTVVFTLTGFSYVPLPNWSLMVSQQGGTVRLTPVVSPSTINNGGTATVTVVIPRNARPGYASFVINSSQSSTRNRQVAPIAIVIQ